MHNTTVVSLWHQPDHGGAETCAMALTDANCRSKSDCRPGKCAAEGNVYMIRNSGCSLAYRCRFGVGSQSFRAVSRRYPLF